MSTKSFFAGKHSIRTQFLGNQSSEKEMQVSELNSTARLESDLDLVKRAQQGDSDAFASLFYAHKARIYSVCLRMTNNTAEAEDLTQDAFLQVFRKLATFRGDSALSTWLYRIAVNTVLMHFRKKALRQVSLDEPYNQDAKQVRREYGSRDGRLVSSVDRIALTRAIKELPVGYRTIFLLHEVEGYEHQEIAELLDCSVGNSKSQLHKAKLRIRELLGYAREEVVEVAVITTQQRVQHATNRRGAASSERWKKQPAEWERQRGSMLPALNTGAPNFVGSNA
jgi:RNA polymerase sigma-70 factor, ECF subfamily